MAAAADTRRSSGARSLAPVALGAALLTAGSAFAEMVWRPPSLLGWYALSEASVQRMTADVTFTLRIKNVGDSEAVFDEMCLANPSNADGRYAEFESFRLAVDEDRTFSARVTVPIGEYERWRKGGAARVFYYVPCPSVPRFRARLDLDRDDSLSP